MLFAMYEIVITNRRGAKKECMQQLHETLDKNFFSSPCWKPDGVGGGKDRGIKWRRKNGVENQEVWSCQMTHSPAPGKKKPKPVAVPYRPWTTNSSFSARLHPSCKPYVILLSLFFSFPPFFLLLSTPFQSIHPFSTSALLILLVLHR
jgi:hypothetical protein